MLKNCSACQAKHSPPYGSYCKTAKSKNMAKSSGNIPARDSPEYLVNLENQLAATKEKDDTLQTIMSRLDKLEVSSAVRSRAATTTATIPTTATTTVTTSLSTPTTTSWSAPWSAPPFGQPPVTPWSSQPISSHQWSVRPPVSSTASLSPSVPPGFSHHPTSSLPYYNYGVTNRGTSMASPLDLVTTPLTTALEQLSQANEPTIPASTKGIQLRPEYYIQHIDQGVALKSIDHTKLTYKELVSGMVRVLEYLVSANGDATSYIEHLAFVTKQASLHSFYDSAYVSYNRSVVDKVVRGSSIKFIAGDTLSASSHFHAGNTHQNKRQSGRGRGFRGRRSANYDSDQVTSEASLVPDGFPVDICYNYNYKSCSGNNCSKQHIC